MTARNASALDVVVRSRSDGTTIAAGPRDSHRGVDPGNESGEHVRSRPAIDELRDIAPLLAALPIPEADDALRAPRPTRPVDVGPELVSSARPTAPSPVLDTSSAHRPLRETMRLWPTPPDDGLHDVAAAPDSTASDAPIPKGPVSAPVVRIRAVHAIGDVERGQVKGWMPAPMITERHEPETLTDLATLRRYSVSTPFAIEAPHTGWRWFVGLAALTFAASGLLMLFDGL